MARLKTFNRGDAFLAEAVARAEQLVSSDVEEYRRFKAEGSNWRQRRENRGIELHELARRLGLSSLDLWFLEGGLPPLSHSRAEVASALEAILFDSSPEDQHKG